MLRKLNYNNNIVFYTNTVLNGTLLCISLVLRVRLFPQIEKQHQKNVGISLSQHL